VGVRPTKVGQGWVCLLVHSAWPRHFPGQGCRALVRSRFREGWRCFPAPGSARATPAAASPLRGPREPGRAPEGSSQGCGRSPSSAQLENGPVFQFIFNFFGQQRPCPAVIRLGLGSPHEAEWTPSTRTQLGAGGAEGCPRSLAHGALLPVGSAWVTPAEDRRGQSSAPQPRVLFQRTSALGVSLRAPPVLCSFCGELTVPQPQSGDGADSRYQAVFFPTSVSSGK